MTVGEILSDQTGLDRGGTKRVAFIILPNFSMIALASAVDPLRLANRVAGKTLFEWLIYSCDGQPVRASNHLEVTADAHLNELLEADLVLVVSGVRVERIDYDPLLGRRLKTLSARGIPLGSLCTGTYVLAHFNLLEGYRCTIHWENLRSFREEFPEIDVSSDIFEIDRKRFTCAGGTAALDMMLVYLARLHGATLMRQVAEVALHKAIRTGDEAQRDDLENRIGVNNRVVLEAISIMDEHIEDPLSCQQLALAINISSRQVERLFKKFFNCTPGHYYLQLRLDAARDLLRRTNRAILDVAIACGFVSTSHFAKCYRERFGHTPTEERRSMQWLPDGQTDVRL